MGFPKQLKRARLNMDYTQQQVADLMGITKSTYCGYETGKRQPDVAKIKQLARILNTSGDILLEIDLNQEPSFENVTSTLNYGDITNELNIDEEVIQLAQQYSQLNDSDRELVRRMIDSLSQKNNSP